MGAKIAEVVERLGADPDMVRQFRSAYGRGPDSANVLDAIAVFERSLLTPGSRFDRWLAGDEGALSPEEQNGYSLFKSLGCVSCHQGVNIGGNLFQRHGIFQPLASPLPEISACRACEMSRTLRPISMMAARRPSTTPFAGWALVNSTRR